MAEFMTAVLLHNAAVHAAHNYTSSYQPSYSEPVYSAPTTYVAPQRFPGRSPRSPRDWDNVVERSVESRWTPSSSKQAVTRQSELDIDAYVDIRSRELSNSTSNRMARYGGTAISKVSPWLGPRAATTLMEGQHKDDFGIRDELASPAFKKEMRQASGRDIEDLTRHISKSAGKFARKTVKAWNHDNEKEAWGMVKEGAIQLSRELEPHATQAAETFVEEHKEHVSAVGGPIVHAVGVVRMAKRGHKNTKARLGKAREVCSNEAKQQHKSKLSGVVDKVFSRKSKDKK